MRAMSEAMTELYHPFLVGASVYLRRVERQDLETEYFQWLNDSDVVRYMSNGTFPNSLENMLAYYESSTRSQTRINLAIVTIEDGRHIGNIGLNNINWGDGTAELGHLIGVKSYWGKGVAAEAVELITGYAFDRLNLRRLTAGMHAPNVPVVILFKKLGWVQEGRRREHVLRNNQAYDVIQFGLLRREYYERRKEEEPREVSEWKPL